MSQVTPQARAKREIYRLLEKVLTNKVEQCSAPTVIYEKGFSDQSIADYVSPLYPEAKITAKTVAGIRSRAWGNLEKPLSMKDTLAKLQKENKALKEQLSKINNEPLEEAISNEFSLLLGEGSIPSLAEGKLINQVLPKEDVLAHINNTPDGQIPVQIEPDGTVLPLSIDAFM